VKILSKGAIASALKELRPSHIAVAYLGRDWKTYLNGALPDEIIVSPTLGTHPYALAEIGEAMGWDNVYLLKELHAKIYLSITGAILGSPNLTANGLHGERLEEIAIRLDNPKLVGDLKNEFDRLRDLARLKFKTTKAKLDAVHDLERRHGQAVAHEFILEPKETKRRDVADYVAGNDSFYIAWWGTEDLQLNDNQVNKAFDDEFSIDEEKPIGECLTFLDEDKISPGKWILSWVTNDDGFPDRRKPLKWMYIDKVVRNGAIHKENQYTQLVFSRTDRKAPPIPFHIDARTKKAIFDVLEFEKYKMFVWDANVPWSIAPTIKEFRHFMEDVKSIAASHAD